MSNCIQTYIAVASFVVAVVLSFIGFFTPPRGDLTEANLYLVAQFLLVCTSILGVSSMIGSHRSTKGEEGPPAPKGGGYAQCN